MTVKVNSAVLQDSILQFWFGSETDALAIAKRQAELWWGKSSALDTEIRERFGALREQVVQGECDSWRETARGRLALIISVDQFSRNMFRGKPEAFSYDYLAQEWCLDGLDSGADAELQPIERVFFYLPLEHSESRVDQVRSVACFSELLKQAPPQQQELFAGYLDFARKHQAIVERFARFPHRNQILDRTSTDAEIRFLEEPGSSF